MNDNEEIPEAEATSPVALVVAGAGDILLISVPTGTWNSEKGNIEMALLKRGIAVIFVPPGTEIVGVVAKPE